MSEFNDAHQQYFTLKKTISQIIDETGYLTSEYKINKFVDLLSDKLFNTTIIKDKNSNKLILKFRDCTCKHTKDTHSRSNGRCLNKPCNCKEYIPN